jgi:hypothetical protein
MSYESVDPIFYAWAKRHGLAVATEYKDEEVRAVQVYSRVPRQRRGKVVIHQAGIALFPIKSGEPIGIGVGSSPYRPSRFARHAKLEASLDTLDAVLEQAYRQAVEWLAEDESA